MEMIRRKSERTGHFRNKIFLFLLIGMIIGILSATATAELQMRVATFVQDREFPELLPYVWDGWDLKHDMGQTKEYSQIVRLGATLHAFVANESNQPITVEHVLLNDIDLSTHIVPAHREHRGAAGLGAGRVGLARIRVRRLLRRERAAGPDRTRRLRGRE